MLYQEVIANHITITSMLPEYAEQLEVLHRVVFPNLAEDELLHAKQYRKHIEIFPEGQFVALDGNRVVGATSSIRYHFDINHQQHHSFYEVMGGGWFTTHDPQGEWLYGMDISVHPAYRGKSIARALYRARQHTCTALGLKGQMTVGMLNGYAGVRDIMSIETYYEKVKAHELFDPTVSVQEKIGFTIVGLMKDYLNDSTCGNAGAVIVLPANVKI
ncbi:MAG TPA: GNAT family N-acetyltransferase [Chitinophagaceae bacterium]|nr:GNAT family N-acetyltransferase [Chitinophagaceae bacterium]